MPLFPQHTQSPYPSPLALTPWNSNGRGEKYHVVISYRPSSIFSTFLTWEGAGTAASRGADRVSQEGSQEGYPTASWAMRIVRLLTLNTRS